LPGLKGNCNDDGCNDPVSAGSCKQLGVHHWARSGILSEYCKGGELLVKGNGRVVIGSRSPSASKARHSSRVYLTGPRGCTEGIVRLAHYQLQNEVILSLVAERERVIRHSIDILQATKIGGVGKEKGHETSNSITLQDGWTKNCLYRSDRESCT
jgi:hypothetical protein